MRIKEKSTGGKRQQERKKKKERKREWERERKRERQKIVKNSGDLMWRSRVLDEYNAEIDRG